MKNKCLQLEIKMFGEFDILINGVSIFNKFTRLPIIIELLQYMIANYNKELLPSTIADDIWPEKDYQDINKVLRTYIYRLKQFLSGNNYLEVDLSEKIRISNNNGKYKLEISEDCIFDVELLEDLMKEADDSDMTLESIESLRKVIEIYRGEFLKNTIYTHWALPFRNLYLDYFINISDIIISTLYNNKLYKNVVKFCEQIFEIYDLDEELNIFFLRALLAEGRVNDALEHYSYITSKMYTELNIKPSDELKDIYNLLKKPSTSNESLEKKEETYTPNNSIQTLFVKRFPRNFKKYKLNTLQELAIGLIRYQPNLHLSTEEKNEMFLKVRQFLDIIIIKDYYICSVTDESIVLFIRDVKKDFVNLLSEQIKNFITISFPNKLTFNDLRIVNNQTKDTLLNKERAKI